MVDYIEQFVKRAKALQCLAFLVPFERVMLINDVETADIQAMMKVLYRMVG
jgi:hypothetical protein